MTDAPDQANIDRADSRSATADSITASEDSRTATADSIAASADSRLATADSRTATGRSQTSTSLNDKSTITLIVASLALVVSGGFGLWNQHQNAANFDSYKACVNGYAKANSEALMARQDSGIRLQRAQQAIFDDVAKLRGQPPANASPAQVKAARAAERQFYTDLTAEQVAAEALNDQRQKHPYPEPPAVACP